MDGKKKLIIWGTGRNAVRLCHYLDWTNIEISGFTDNSGQTEVTDSFLSGVTYLPIGDALDSDYDFIVIASMAYCEITLQLLNHGVGREKIIQAYNTQFMIPESLYYFSDLETDEEKYAIFTSLDSFSSRLM